MLIGSFIAGATSEGGGAVAFPVMTLILKIRPNIARDFSLLIQSFGMMSALFTILKLKVRYCKNILLYSIPFGLIGQFIGYQFLDQLLTPVMIKITFTSIWLSFALVLFLIKDHTFTNTDISSDRFSLFIISLVSIIGGTLTSLTGSGIDILIF